MTLIRSPHETRPSEPETIKARSGWLIPCEKVDVRSSALMEIRTKVVAGWRPNAVLRSASTFPYNCMGLVFASRRAWIEIDYVYTVLKEDGYRQVSVIDAVVGDVVLYKTERGDPSHVGLIVEKYTIGSAMTIKVISKWGQEAEFIHAIDNVLDLLGRPSEYWTDRP